MSIKKKAVSDDNTEPRVRGSRPPAAMTTSVVMKTERRRVLPRPPWEVVERFAREGQERAWVESYAMADPAFAGDLDLRLCAERPPWRLVERWLRTDEPCEWVDWYRRRSPAFNDLIEARCGMRRPPWAVVDDYARRARHSEYREWVEGYASTSRAFAEVLASMRDQDDEQGARVIPLRPRDGARHSST
jgi:hypothetical protein